MGDVVEKVTEKTGLKKLVKDIFGNECGCEERKKWLNKHASWSVSVKMTQDQINVYNRLKKYRKSQTIPADVNSAITNLYNEVFNPQPKAEPVTCSSCAGILYSRLETLSFVAERTECEFGQK